MPSSPSVVVLRKSSDGVGLSLWTNKMTDMESQVNLASVGSMEVAEKTLEQGKVGETNKRLCACAPTTHPGSFRCRYHRSVSVQNMKPVQDPAGAVARHFLKLGINNKTSTKPTSSGLKPQASRFSKAATTAAAAAQTASELPR